MPIFYFLCVLFFSNYIYAVGVFRFLAGIWYSSSSSVPCGSPSSSSLSASMTYTRHIWKSKYKKKTKNNQMSGISFTSSISNYCIYLWCSLAFGLATFRLGLIVDVDRIQMVFGFECIWESLVANCTHKTFVCVIIVVKCSHMCNYRALSSKISLANYTFEFFPSMPWILHMSK